MTSNKGNEILKEIHQNCKLNQELTNTDLGKYAEKYGDANLSVIATGNNKRALRPWSQFRRKKASSETILEQFKNKDANGIGLICGAVSGNVEVLDLDLKNDISNCLFQDLITLINKSDPDILKKLLIIQTPSKGFHFIYRCDVIGANQKLASRYSTENEKLQNPNISTVILIETRGEGGYAIHPPTKGYTVYQSEGIQTISTNERENLLNICRSFNEISPKEEFKSSNIKNTSFLVTPWEDYNLRGNVAELLEENGWKEIYKKGVRTYFRRPGKADGISADYNEELRLFKNYSTSSNVPTDRGLKPSALYTYLKHDGDFSRAAKQLFVEGYGENFNSAMLKLKDEVLKMLSSGKPEDQILNKIMEESESVKDIDEAAKVLAKIKKYGGPKICAFWEIAVDTQIKIKQSKLISFLRDEGGFYLYYFNKKNYQYIKVDNLLVEEVTIEQIKKFIKNYIISLPEHFDGGKCQNDLLEVLLKGSTSYFNKSILEFLDNIELNFLNDTATICYTPFKNAVVAVTKKTIELKSYKEIGKHIWKSQIIDSEIDLIEDPESTSIEYCKFLDCISSHEVERLDRAMSSIGYLLHRYKSPSSSYAVVLAEETENEDQGGGTGKGIFVKALSYMQPVERIDGKNFKTDKTFAYQRVQLATRIIAIEDCRKNLDFEGFYSTITEGITIERKNKDEFYISYEHSPKFLFSTNYTISKLGNHAKRRQMDLEFSSYFHPGNTPFDEFGHQLFYDWDQNEWNNFYNFMLSCQQKYLENGLEVIDNSVKNKCKQIRNHYSEEFLDWWKEYSLKGYQEWTLVGTLYTGFLESSEFEKKDYSSKRFKYALIYACNIFGVELQKRTSSKNGNKIENRVEDVSNLLGNIDWGIKI